MARKKKKVVHWSKLPRTKLIAMVKRLELANAKLKTQLAEARETKLLNTREGALKYHSVQHVNPATVQTPEDWRRVNQGTPNAKTVAAMQELDGDGATYEVSEVHGNMRVAFPWEKK